jgi:hypothetical protein
MRATPSHPVAFTMEGKNRQAQNKEHAYGIKERKR